MRHQCGPKLELDYPCRWEYTLIGREETAIDRAVRRAVGDREVEAAHSRTSRQGTYVSVKIRVTVMDEADRRGILEALQASEEIRYVL